MSDVLRQVDEDLRKDRILSLWKKYGIYIIVFILLLISSVIGYQINKSFSISNNQKQVENYLIASNLPSENEIVSSLSNLENSSNTFMRGLIRLKMANSLISQGKKEQSQAILIQLMKDREINKIINDAAGYFYLMSKLNEITKDEILAYFPDNQIDNSTFKYLFLELFALHDLFSGDFEQTNKSFQKIINDPEAPREIIIRSEKFLESIK
tara:strand:- start:10 stop:642 length:633 start_codon:yes stop_codon:yes gene_type:complete